MTGIPFKNHPPHGWLSTDGSNMFFRQHDKPTLVAVSSIASPTERRHNVDLGELEHVRSVRCVGLSFTSNETYTVYLGPATSSKYRDTFIAVGREFGSWEIEHVDIFTAAGTLYALANSLGEGDLWAAIHLLRQTDRTAYDRGTTTVMGAFRDGRLVWEGRGRKRHATITPAA